MGKSPSQSPEQLAAASLYGWYAGRVETQAAARQVHHWITSHFADVSLSPQALAMTFTHLREQRGFEKVRVSILKRWHTSIPTDESLPEQQVAEQFLEAVIQNQDHGTLIVPGVSAGVTRVEQGQLGDVRYYLTSEREHWIFHLTTAGSALYCADRDLEASPGTLVLIKPTAHCYYHRHPQSPAWTHNFVLFQPRIDLSRWLHWPEVADGILSLTLHDDVVINKLNHLLDEIRLLTSDYSGNQQELCLNLMEQLFIRASAVKDAADTLREDNRITMACDYLRQNLTQSLSVDDVAAHCHLSASRLSHLFKTAMGIGIKQFQTRLRMLKARQLLTSSEQPIETIASAVGYNDPAQFSKYFRKQHGCSPREFRRQYR